MSANRPAACAVPGGPRVALICPGTGRERRGYERITADMFEVLRDAMDVTLFKGGGARSEREVVPWSLARDGWLLMHVPLHRLIGRTRYHVECLTFAMSLAPRLVAGGFDVVFTYDPPMLKLLWWIRRLTGANYRILFAHGGAFPFRYWPRADFALHCTPLSYREDLEAGVDQSRIALLPIGIWPERFAVSASRSELRRKYGVPESTLLILSISALNRTQKRVHHLIEEVARLEGEVLLWIDGSQNFDADLSLKQLAAQRLGERCRITYGPSEHVGELLAMADVMVIASILEGFGLAIVEALCAGTPTLTHDSPHFHWLVGKQELMVDMSVPGALAQRLQALVEDHDALRQHVDVHDFRQRYSWISLRQQYVELLHAVHRGGASLVGRHRGGQEEIESAGLRGRCTDR